MIKFFYLTCKSIFIYIINVCKLIFATLLNVLNFLIDFLSPVVNSICGRLNEQEIYRIVALTLSTGGTVWSVLQGLYNNIGTIVTDPALANQIKLFVEIAKHSGIVIAFMVVVFMGDFIRRKYTHGEQV